MRISMLIKDAGGDGVAIEHDAVVDLALTFASASADEAMP
jgi:hypothetical protein